MTIDDIARLGEAHHPTRTIEVAKLLRQAADLHHTYEQELGHADPDWTGWYAHWLEPQLETLFKRS